MLVFQDGEKVNLYHVLEKADGSFSPISNESLSGKYFHIKYKIELTKARNSNDTF